MLAIYPIDLRAWDAICVAVQMQSVALRNNNTTIRSFLINQFWWLQDIQVYYLQKMVFFVTWIYFMQLHWCMTRVRKCNWGWHFFPFKCCVSQLSVDRFGKNFEGVMTLGQVRSSPNFCSFGQQRAEKHNFWRQKNTNLNLNSGLWK